MHLEKLILMYIDAYIGFPYLAYAFIGAYKGIHTSLVVPLAKALLNSLTSNDDIKR